MITEISPNETLHYKLVLGRVKCLWQFHAILRNNVHHKQMTIIYIKWVIIFSVRVYGLLTELE